MHKKTFQTHSPEETLHVAADFAKQLLKAKEGAVIALQGELGAGKTCFAKGVIQTLTDVALEDIPSPTFTLVESYEVDPKVRSRLKFLYHVDLYRIESAGELDALAWEDWLDPQVWTLVEWPEHFPKLFSHCQWRLKFSKGEKNLRHIEIEKQVEDSVKGLEA